MASLSSNLAGDGLYDPPIPTYEEAIAVTSSASAPREALPSPSTFDAFSPMAEAFYAPEHENNSLLRRSHQRNTSTASSGRNGPSRPRPGGYRPPTVRSDDEDSTWSSTDSESGHGHGNGHGYGYGHDDEADIEADARDVQRAMFEMEMEDPIDATSLNGRGRASIFGKGFSLSLPKWASNWRLSIARLRIPFSDGTSSGPGAGFAARFRQWPGFTRLRGTDGDDDGDEMAASGSAADANSASSSRWRRCGSTWFQADKTRFFAILGRMLFLLVIVGLVYVLFVSDLFNSLTRRLGTQTFDPESVRAHIQAMVSPSYLREITEHFSSYPHIAGTQGDWALAVDTQKLFQKYGLEDVTVDEYLVYLNYPTADGRAVEILGDHGKATWTAKLEEEDVGFKTKGHQTYAFHGLSKSGDVNGPLLYANYGSREDFQKLHDMGFNTTGAIAVVRTGGTQADQALKVKAAELTGFAGCLIYSDPSTGGFLRGKTAPKGRFLPKDGLERGSVSLMSWVIGDVLTPGWESIKKLPRLSPEKSSGLVQIPSLPLSWRDAEVLLQHLQQKGQRTPKDWTFKVDGIDWWTGDPSTSPVVRLKNEQDEVKQQAIWNVYARIEGVEQTDKRIIIGNHRDAWSYGATDPHSGTAVMLEMARIFGDLLTRGWRPLRTIEFMSWDAKEYNLVGSTEYVEANIDRLRENAYAYINLDTVVAGQELRATGSPMFSKLLAQVLKRVSAPHSNSTLYDFWARRGGAIDVPGAGSDSVPFQCLAGTSSLDLFFDGDYYPLHSSYDTYHWVAGMGDPDFSYHVAMAQVVGLVLVELAERPIIPFDMTNYAALLSDWVQSLIQDIQAAHGTAELVGTDGHTRVDYAAILAACTSVNEAVKDFESWSLNWETSVLSSGGWESPALGQQRIEYINRMARFETDLLDLEAGGGIPNRTQFKHVVFGPQLWSSYDGALFPAMRDLMDAKQWVEANKTLGKIADIFRTAAANLIK